MYSKRTLMHFGGRELLTREIYIYFHHVSYSDCYLFLSVHSGIKLSLSSLEQFDAFSFQPWKVPGGLPLESDILLVRITIHN